MIKKILYLGDFRQSFSTERYIAHALRELGIEVFLKQEGNFMVGNSEGLVNELKQWECDLVLFSKGKPIGDAHAFMKDLKKAGIPTACWLFDLYFDLPLDRTARFKPLDVPFNSDVVYVTDGGHHEKFRQYGINSKTLRQGIHEPEAILYVRDFKRDIVFVGADTFQTRAPMLGGLKLRYGERYERYGNNPQNQIRGLELNELYASTKIVVGDSQESPHYWSNRVYETLGRGGFLLHPKVEGIEEEFVDGEHLVLYDRNDLDGLYKKIDYYLKHHKEREKIREAGFNLVKSKYTYKDRCIELLKNYD